MAEFVEQSMEEMLPELEQLERVQLLSSDEVKQVIKMRRRFEYKIQKQTKKKEDFLAYIQYESSLLSLVAIRRDKMSYEFKKNDIDYNISRRINKLFRILEHRFGRDVKIWSSHVEFLKNMNWKVECSKVLRRFIQAHTDKPQVWISAAKYELEFVGNPDTARKIMLEGLRFHPVSSELFKEYFRLELIYVDLLRKRSQVLGIDGTGGISEESRDKVIEGEVVLTVLKMGVKAIEDVGFVASLLHVISSCDDPDSFAKVKDRIVQLLREDFSECYLSWDTLAREALARGCPLSEVCRLYEEGLDQIQELDELEDLLECYIGTLESIPSLLPSKDSLRLLGHKLLQVFEYGHNKKILKDQFYSEWISLLETSNDASKKISSVLATASQLYPTSLLILKEEIALSFHTGSPLSEIIEMFFRGIEKNPSMLSKDFLELMFVNISSRDGSALEGFYTRIRGSSTGWDRSLRIMYLEHLYTVKGISAARDFYDEHRYEPPFDLDFQLKALELEVSVTGILDKGRVRNIYDVATDQFGKENMDIWLQYIAFETKNGKSSTITSIASRAENSLKTPELKEKFRIEFESR